MANKEHEAGMVVGSSVVAHTAKGTTVTEAVLKLSQERDKAYAELIIVSDSLRLANITIEQQKRTIEELRAKGHRTDEEMDALLDLIRADARADTMKQVAKELNEAGIKHGTFFSDQGQETWHYGTKRMAFGAVETHPEVGKKPDTYAVKLDRSRNDNLLNAAFAQCGQTLKAEVVPEIQRVNAYLTVTRVGEEETITAQVDGPESVAEHIGSALRGIAIALQRHDDCCDFGLDLSPLAKE